MVYISLWLMEYGFRKKINQFILSLLFFQGFSVEGQENIQEVLSKQLYLCQFLTALSILRPGQRITSLIYKGTHSTIGRRSIRLTRISPIRLSPIGESPLYFRQHALMTFTNGPMSTVLSPVYVIYRLEDSLSTTLITESNKIYSDIFSPHMYPTFVVLCNEFQKSIILSPTYSHDLLQLARVHRTFANIPPGLSLIDKSPPYFSGLSPLANVLLAKVLLVKFGNPFDSIF